MAPTDPSSRIRVHAAGRVNLIGEHTDYTGGLALPMAIELGTTVDVRRIGDIVSLVSDSQTEPVHVRVDVTDPASVHGWGRYVAGVVAELRPTVGALGDVASNLPIGSGLSSSASLQIAVALALGFDGTATELALLCQRAEQRASGVPCGVMDQMAIAHGSAGNAVLLDCHALTVEAVAIPDDVEVVVIPSGVRRELAASAYAQRRLECEAAEAVVGPLRSASLCDVADIDDPLLERRARHVITENGRVGDFVAALRDRRFDDAGSLLTASHASLRQDFEVTSPVVDEIAARALSVAGVHGARMVGGGFGGVVVALAEPGCSGLSALGGFSVRPSAGTTVETLPG